MTRVSPADAAADDGGQHPRNRPQSAVKTELTEHGGVPQTVVPEPLVGHQQGQRDREVVVRADLRHVRRVERHGDPTVGPAEADC